MSEQISEVQELSDKVAKKIIQAVGELGTSSVVVHNPTNFPQRETITLSSGGIVVEKLSQAEARYDQLLYKRSRNKPANTVATDEIEVDYPVDPYQISLKIAVVSDEFCKPIFGINRGHCAIDPFDSVHYVFKEVDGFWQAKRVPYPDSQPSSSIGHLSGLTVYYTKEAEPLNTVKQLEDVLSLCERYDVALLEDRNVIE